MERENSYPAYYLFQGFEKGQEGMSPYETESFPDVRDEANPNRCGGTNAGGY